MDQGQGLLHDGSMFCYCIVHYIAGVDGTVLEALCSMVISARVSTLAMCCWVEFLFEGLRGGLKSGLQEGSLGRGR